MKKTARRLGGFMNFPFLENSCLPAIRVLFAVAVRAKKKCALSDTPFSMWGNT